MLRGKQREENVMYEMKRTGGIDWKMVRVLRKGGVLTGDYRIYYIRIREI